MNKTELFKNVVDDVDKLGKSLQAFYSSLISDADDLGELSDEEAPDTPILLGDVRAVLAEKSRMGMTSAVRNLLGEYGVEKLSDLKPQYYAEILKKAEELNNDI